MYSSIHYLVTRSHADSCCSHERTSLQIVPEYLRGPRCTEPPFDRYNTRRALALRLSFRGFRPSSPPRTAHVTDAHRTFSRRHDLVCERAHIPSYDRLLLRRFTSEDLCRRCTSDRFSLSHSFSPGWQCHVPDGRHISLCAGNGSRISVGIPRKLEQGLICTHVGWDVLQMRSESAGSCVQIQIF